MYGVAGLTQNYQPRLWQVAVHGLCHSEREQAIVLAPDKEGRLFEGRQILGAIGMVRGRRAEYVSDSS